MTVGSGRGPSTQNPLSLASEILSLNCPVRTRVARPIAAALLVVWTEHSDNSCVLLLPWNPTTCPLLSGVLCAFWRHVMGVKVLETPCKFVRGAIVVKELKRSLSFEKETKIASSWKLGNKKFVLSSYPFGKCYANAIHWVTPRKDIITEDGLVISCDVYGLNLHCGPSLSLLGQFWPPYAIEPKKKKENGDSLYNVLQNKN